MHMAHACTRTRTHTNTGVRLACTPIRPAHTGVRLACIPIHVVHTGVHTHTHPHTHTHTYLYIHAQTHTHTHTPIPANTHTHPHTVGEYDSGVQQRRRGATGDPPPHPSPPLISLSLTLSPSSPLSITSQYSFVCIHTPSLENSPPTACFRHRPVDWYARRRLRYAVFTRECLPRGDSTVIEHRPRSHRPVTEDPFRIPAGLQQK
jgi:hypothetical protein